MIAVALIASLGARANEPATPPSPQVLFRDLYAAVEIAGVFPDSKTFADAVPTSDAAALLVRFHAEQPRTRDQLAQFVAAHFTLPRALDTGSSATPYGLETGSGATPHAVGMESGARSRASLQAHIDSLWPWLTRGAAVAPPQSSLLPLPRQYVVPGGRFREMYYWDSYFTMLGLVESGRRDLVESMTANFAHLIDVYGHVPNGNRTYYLSRSQPPFFFAMVGLLEPLDRGAAFARYLPQLKREYAFWMQGAAPLAPGGTHRRVVSVAVTASDAPAALGGTVAARGVVLNRYWDDATTPRDESYREDTALAAASRPCGAAMCEEQRAAFYRNLRAAAESGWDFSSRWLADGRTLATIETTAIVPVDLNSLLFGLERAIERGCGHAQQRACAREFAKRADARHAAVESTLWSDAAGAYVDHRQAGEPHGGAAVGSARITAATLYPLFVGLASTWHASAVAATVRSQLLKPGGIVTTTVQTGEQWDSPNGWAPLQWVAVSGLRDYGHDRLAAAIACRWIVNVSRVYESTEKLLEKYDVVDLHRPGGGGEYPLQDGFGWTNGVTRRLLALYPNFAQLRRIEDCPAP